MAISKVAVSQDAHRLMLAIGEAVRLHTSQSPMSGEQIVGVLGFCSGAAIVRASTTRNDRRQMREMAVANVDMGIQAMTSSMANTSLIIPEGVM